MNFKKTVVIAAAAGALAAISVPAMAVENEFHGSFTFNSIFSNFQDGGSGDFNAFTAVKAPANNYFEQRARINYIAKASDDLKFVTHFEINNRFGNLNTVTNSQGSAADISGSDIDTDGMNLVTKHAYLDFNLGKDFNAKLGLQAYKDTIGGLLIDADVPAIVTTTKLGSYSLGLGFTRYSDRSSTVSAGRLGDVATDLFILDNKFAINKDTSAAFSYYLLADYSKADQEKTIHTFGLSGSSKTGPLTLGGFAALQVGRQENTTVAAKKVAGTDTVFQAYALNLNAKVAAGPGTGKFGFLLASGDTNSTDNKNTGWSSTGTNSYNGTGLMIIARDTANSPTSTDRYLRRVVTNIAVLNAGYDANLSAKCYTNFNLGMAFNPASGTAKADYMGTEFNLEVGYKVNPNLTLRAQTAAMILGPYYNSTNPDDPYTLRLLASFKF